MASNGDDDLPKTKITDSDSGILQPPDDIKSIIDKTAVWVARNGASFEVKVSEKQKNNPQFSFLRPGNAYYAYYQQKVREIRREEGIAAEGDEELVQNAAELRLQIKKTILGELPLDDDDKKKKKKVEQVPLEPPPVEVWILEKPSLPAVQEDILKLTAQFVARNGPSFQSGLLTREGANPQFGFLMPFHPLHNYFKVLVQQYTNCLLVERGVIESLEALSLDKEAVVEKVMKKVRWERAQKKNIDSRRQEEEAERNAMAQIDWHEFSIVQVINYEDETEAEPAPEVAPPPVSVPVPEVAPEAAPDEMDVEMDIEEIPSAIDTSKVQVLTDFNPRARPAAAANAGLTFLTPSGQKVAAGDLEEHMKIETANIRAMEERKKKELAERPSNLVNDQEFVKSLRNFASQRSDIFVDADKKAGGAQKPVAVWDGHMSSILKVTQAAASNKSDVPVQEAPKGDAIGPVVAAAGSKSSVPGPLPSTANPFGAVPAGFRPPMPGMPGAYPPMMGMPGPPPGMFPPGMPHPSQIPPHMRPPAMDEPAMKRPRTDDGLFGGGEAAFPGMTPERDWIAGHPGPISIVVKVPKDEENTQFPFNGQSFRVEISASDSIKTLKDKISEHMNGMAANKQKLQLAPFGVLGDNRSLAYYNLQSNVEIDLGMKERGGRKK